MINERVLRYRDVRVIGAEGESLGILQSRHALNQARELGLDLLLVSATSVPPVCKIVNYGRMKYEEAKISPRIAQHDLETMTNRAKEFLSKGHRVKLTCVFKAREVSHPEYGDQK